VPPRERCGVASLHSNNSIGLRSWVGAAVADYVVCGYVVDGLGVVLVDWLGVDRGRKINGEGTEGTYTIVSGDADAISNCAVVDRKEDRVCGGGRCCCDEGKRSGELHVVGDFWL
jgi:hypothetical protein